MEAAVDTDDSVIRNAFDNVSHKCKPVRHESPSKCLLLSFPIAFPLSRPLSPSFLGANRSSFRLIMPLNSRLIPIALSVCRLPQCVLWLNGAR